MEVHDPAQSDDCMWRDRSARACVPPPDLLESTLPVRGTAFHAVTSPWPSGLGVYSMGSEGKRKVALSLYYVSKKLADKRKRFAADVDEGWYVVAMLGTQFEVAVPAV